MHWEGELFVLKHYSNMLQDTRPIWMNSKGIISKTKFMTLFLEALLKPRRSGENNKLNANWCILLKIVKPGGAIITLSVLAARNWWQVTWIRYRTLIAFLWATPQEWSGIRAHLLAKNRSFVGFIGSFLDRLGIFDNSLPQQMSRWRSSVYHLGTIPTAWSFVPSSLGFWNPIVVATNLRPTIRISFANM